VCARPELILLPPLHSAEIRIGLDQLGKRKAPDFSSVYEGKTVVVRGVVSAPAVRFTDYSLLAIEAREGAVSLKWQARIPG